MSLFDHLVERALDLARPVEPVIDPSPLGPPVLGPSPSVGFEETHVERVAGRPSGPAPTSPRTIVADRSAPSSVSPGPTPFTSPPSSPGVVEPRIAGPTIVGSPRAEPRSSSPSLIVREREPASVIVERRVERVERTHERIHESSPTIEPRIADAPSLLASPVRVRASSPSEASPLGPARAARGEPSESIEPIEPSPTIAAPVQPAPVRRESPALASPPTPVQRVAAASPSPSTNQPLARRVAAPEPGPTLRIEIGRVIVRAEAPAPAKRGPSASGRPMTSLADYLASRERGDR